MANLFSSNHDYYLGFKNPLEWNLPGMDPVTSHIPALHVMHRAWLSSTSTQSCPVKHVLFVVHSKAFYLLENNN